MAKNVSAGSKNWAGLRAEVGKIVLVFQGGGALGAFQAGVYEALHEEGIEPDWIIGTSIGAINASLIAGNRFEDRLAKLSEFWSRVEHRGFLGMMSSAPGFGPMFANMATVANGLEAFFRPNPMAFLSAHAPLDPEAAGYYSTSPLKSTLSDLVDFERIAGNAPRLTVGAANVVSGAMRYFDSRESAIDVRHILASGALPPAFPAVRIDGELYWDGGILSNTPVEAVFDDFPRSSSLIFAVHVWNPRGREPGSIWEVMSRQKDVQYASRISTHIRRQKELHELRHVISELAGHLKDKKDERVKMLAYHGCKTRMHVVRLVAPMLDGEDHTKDIDFSREGIRGRWEAGREHMRRVLAGKPWEGEFDPIDGLILHETDGGAVAPS